MNSDILNVVQGAVRFDKIYLMPKDRRYKGRRELGYSPRKPLIRDILKDNFSKKYTRSS